MTGGDVYFGNLASFLTREVSSHAVTLKMRGAADALYDCIFEHGRHMAHHEFLISIRLFIPSSLADGAAA